MLDLDRSRPYNQTRELFTEIISSQHFEMANLVPYLAKNVMPCQIEFLINYSHQNID
jgi:hypothetical protein